MARSLCHMELKGEVCCILHWLKTSYLALHIIIVGSGLVCVIYIYDDSYHMIVT